LKTEDGLTGVAETYGGEAPAAALEKLRPRLIGANPFRLTGALVDMVVQATVDLANKSEVGLVARAVAVDQMYLGRLRRSGHSIKLEIVRIYFGEETILKSESGIDDDTAAKLVKIAEKVRNLRTHGLEEGVSTRLLVYAGQLIQGGVEPIAACEATICKPITDDLEMQRSIVEIIATQF